MYVVRRLWDLIFPSVIGHGKFFSFLGIAFP